MNGKVKCTCGWSWNKSDSSVKDMYICHECGRDNSNNMKNGGWLDNYGKEENANDSSVSLPEGFVGEGTFNGPIFENPAVKGQFQMGGSIPGAVGFSYARTQGIPSEGKYAKKTLPSAQNGQEMQYYREGLDWRPKSISKNGSVIKDNMGQWKYPGEITEINSPYITMKGVNYPVLGISDTGDTQMMYPDEEYEFIGEKVTEYPMAKNGVNQQDQKTFEQLDQLTNFTNYNKPTIGGWLNKYN